MDRAWLPWVWWWRTFASAQRIEFSWPTPNRAWEQGKGIEAWAQPTVSGDPESGLFGCVRTNGTQFHEGSTSSAVRPRRARGEPTDKITAAMDGIVRYVNTKPGESNYGRYIVLEHPGLTPAVYTLYAHLARIEPGIGAGTPVTRGQVIGTDGAQRGNTATSPKDRAHMHFEIGLMATTNFAAWYATKKFGSANEHGLYNGMNLMGIDPQDFLRQWRARKRVDNFEEYLDQLRSRACVCAWRRAARRTSSHAIPRCCASRCRRGFVAGWEVECNATGLPFAWTPLTGGELAGMASAKARRGSCPRTQRCCARRAASRSRRQGGSATTCPAPTSRRCLQQVFGLR